MNLLNLNESSLLLVVGIFIAGAGLVWFAGTHLSQYADRFAEKTGIGHAVVGALLLGGITSLPEVATTITASSIGDAKIAINNLFGGIALQVTLLVVADIAFGKRSLSSALTSDAIYLQGIIGVLLLSIVVGIMVVSDVAIWHIGVGSVLVLIMFAGGFSIITYLESIHWWKSEPQQRTGTQAVKALDLEDEGVEKETNRKRLSEVVKSRMFLYLALAALAVLVGGYVVVKSGEAIASQTGIGSSLVGAILVATSTSLPELSTTISAIKLKEYNMAFANIFGTNIFDVGLVFIADAFYTKGAILNEVGGFSIFAAMLGIAVTTVYLLGLSIRYRKTFLRMGYDSLLVLAIYFSGLYVMVTVLKN
jgi:cation:H+ antiporter